MRIWFQTIDTAEEILYVSSLVTDSGTVARPLGSPPGPALGSYAMDEAGIHRRVRISEFARATADAYGFTGDEATKVAHEIESAYLSGTEAQIDWDGLAKRARRQIGENGLRASLKKQGLNVKQIEEALDLWRELGRDVHYDVLLLKDGEERRVSLVFDEVVVAEWQGAVG